MSELYFQRTKASGSEDIASKERLSTCINQIGAVTEKTRIFTPEELFADAHFCDILSESARKVREALPAVRPNNLDEGNSEIVIW